MQSKSSSVGCHKLFTHHVPFFYWVSHLTRTLSLNVKMFRLLKMKRNLIILAKFTELDLRPLSGLWHVKGLACMYACNFAKSRKDITEWTSRHPVTDR